MTYIPPHLSMTYIPQICGKECALMPSLMPSEPIEWNSKSAL
jgi:hypothetical protein